MTTVRHRSYRQRPRRAILVQMWLPWNLAALAALGLVAIGVTARRVGGQRVVAASAWATEAALVFGLYAIWQRAGELSVLHEQGAITRGRQVWDAERWLPLPSELRLQHWLLPHGTFVQIANGYYAVAHVPALVIFLVWMFLRHRSAYPAWRNVVALLTGACLLIQLIPVAPPRFYPLLGFVDTGKLYDQSVYGAVGHGISDQLSAMPSVHVGWAVLVGVGAVLVSSSQWRWLALVHSVLTCLVVVVTGNHWWLDGVVAAAILVAAMGLERRVRALFVRWLTPAKELGSSDGHELLAGSGQAQHSPNR